MSLAVSATICGLSLYVSTGTVTQMVLLSYSTCGTKGKLPLLSPQITTVNLSGPGYGFATLRNVGCPRLPEA